MQPHPLATTAVLVAACTSSDTTIDIQHDICDPIALAAPAATALQLEGIADGIALWRARGVAGLAMERDEPPAIELRFEAAAAAFRGLYDDEHSIIYLNATLSDPRALAIVVAHELGHAFGLDHVEDRASVMNPGNLTVPPNADDEHALRARWGACP